MTRTLASRVEKERASCMMIVGTGRCCNLTEETGKGRKGQGPGLAVEREGRKGDGRDGWGDGRAAIYSGA